MTQEKATATNYDGLWGRQIKAETERKQRMKEPTPRPWKWLPKEGQFLVDAGHNIVAEVPCTTGNPADGALIVTAVNERDALLSEVAQLKSLYDRIFTIKSTGDREHPVQAEIDYDAKAAFDDALERLAKER